MRSPHHHYTKSIFPLFTSFILGAASFATEAEQPVDLKPKVPPAIGSISEKSGAGYELRGFFGSGNETQVSLRHISSGKSDWYRSGQKSGGLTVEKIDAKKGRVTIVDEGIRRTLRLEGEVHDLETIDEVGSEEKARQRKILTERLRAMSPGQINGMRSAFFDIAKRLYAEHPEYFTETGSTTNKARAAIQKMITEGISGGLSTPGPDGKTAEIPDLDAMGSALFAKDSVVLRKDYTDPQLAARFVNNPGDPDPMNIDSVETYSTKTVIDGRARSWEPSIIGGGIGPDDRKATQIGFAVASRIEQMITPNRGR